MRFDRDDFGSNVEDRGQGNSRGGGFGFGGGGGGGGMLGMLLPLILSRFGLVGVIILVVVMFAFGGGLGSIFGGGSGVVGEAPAPNRPAPTGSSVEAVCRSNDTYRFTCNAFGSTERVWTQIFQQSNGRYTPPKLVFYRGGVGTACGAGESAMGPFYCPGDQSIYIDTTFFDELARRFDAPGDFAGAYVVAHEVGHHIQTITGVSERIQRAKAGASQARANALQVRMELQADCLAGAWAANVNISGDTLEPGDLEEGLRAAQQIGDDTLARSAGRVPMPESFTHGTSAQRQEALRRGYQGRSFQACQSYTQGI